MLLCVYVCMCGVCRPATNDNTEVGGEEGKGKELEQELEETAN